MKHKINSTSIDFEDYLYGGNSTSIIEIIDVTTVNDGCRVFLPNPKGGGTDYPKCEYCGSRNTFKEKHCTQCGAPL